MENIIDCNSGEEFVSSVRNFEKANPKAYWKVEDVPRLLRVGVKAMIDDGSTYHFTLGIAKVKRYLQNNSDLGPIFTEFSEARVKVIDLEEKYIDLLTERKENKEEK